MLWIWYHAWIWSCKYLYRINNVFVSFKIFYFFFSMATTTLTPTMFPKEIKDEMDVIMRSVFGIISLLFIIRYFFIFLSFFHPWFTAACERLFSTAGLSFVPKRTSLLVSNFDKLVFLKQNGICFRNWQLCP